MSVVIPESLNPEDFKKAQPRERLCVKCGHVPFQPQRSGCCNALYCLSCSMGLYACPVHGQMMVFETDKALKKSIGRAVLKCPNWRDGCSFEECVSKVYKQHLAECEKSSKNGTRIMLSSCHYHTEAVSIQ